MTTEPTNKKAVSYLRVSSTRQLDTARDVDPDGNSIATQRQACAEKAVALKAQVIAEFMEPGQSAQTIDKRPVFKELLAYLHEHDEVDLVIIYMRSRAFRNLGDAVMTKRALDKLGVRLVSAREDFGQGIMADAMEAVTDIMNEVQVRLSGEDIRVKMAHKAQNGGTLGLARVGYRNIRAEFDGRLVNTIGLDEVRAPLIRQAFELYATGDYTLEALAETMTDLGLTTRATANRTSGPISISHLHRILADPYYTGVVPYKGQTFRGRHPVLISQELFDRVQVVREARSGRGNRDRVHHHYLKGLLLCEDCHRQERTSRLMFTKVNGRGGTYDYFVCSSRSKGLCRLRYLQAGHVEDAVARHHATLALTTEFIARLSGELSGALNDAQATSKEMHRKQQQRLRELDRREERFLDLAADTAMPTAKIHQRLNTIAAERGRIAAASVKSGEHLQQGADLLEAYVELLEDPARLYQRSPEDVRRLLNQTHFQAIYVDDQGVQDDLKTEISMEIAEAANAFERTSGNAKRPGIPAGPLRDTSIASLRDLFEVPGSSKTILVELRGFEPLTPCMPCRCATSCATAPVPSRAREAYRRTWKQLGRPGRAVDRRPGQARGTARAGGAVPRDVPPNQCPRVDRLLRRRTRRGRAGGGAVVGHPPTERDQQQRDKSERCGPVRGTPSSAAFALVVTGFVLAHVLAMRCSKQAERCVR